MSDGEFLWVREAGFDTWTVAEKIADDTYVTIGDDRHKNSGDFVEIGPQIPENNPRLFCGPCPTCGGRLHIVVNGVDVVGCDPVSRDDDEIAMLKSHIEALEQALAESGVENPTEPR